jgi:hypothetical protein
MGLMDLWVSPHKSHVSHKSHPESSPALVRPFFAVNYPPAIPARWCRQNLTGFSSPTRSNSTSSLA